MADEPVSDLEDVDPIVELLRRDLPRLDVSDEWLRATISAAFDRDELTGRRRVRLERRLLVAAAASTTRPEQRMDAAAGGLSARYLENADERLEIEITSPQLVEPLVEVGWTCDDGPAQRLVTALAPTSSGWSARHQPTSLRDVDVLTVEEPRWLRLDALDEELVQGSVGDTAFGVSLRGWRRLLDLGELPPALQGLVRDLLDERGA